MSDNKDIVTMKASPDAPPLLGTVLEHVEGQPPVCDECPTRCGGLAIEAVVEVPRLTKAEPGSKERGCKAVDPRIVGAMGYQSVAACFHPGRWRRIRQSVGQASRVGKFASRLAGIFKSKKL